MVNNKWRYEDLTWPEVNQAVEEELIPVLPVGTIEQHGPHLPIKMDRWTATEIANAAAQSRPDRLLAMPAVAYGYTTHVMDFPGTVTTHPQTFINYVADILKSVAYHGFKRIFVINGHGSNMSPLDLACRRVNMETESQVALASWWGLTAADPGFMATWRESEFPGGCAHACEAETSLGLHLDESIVQMDKAVGSDRNKGGSKFQWVDLWGAGPVSVTGWTSPGNETGIGGDAHLATPQKGKMLFDEAVKNLCEFADEWMTKTKRPREDRHAVPVPAGTPVPG